MRERNRHPHKALTPREVASLSEPGRYADGGGLYLLVARGGSKSWMLRTLVHGKRRDIGLGGVSLVSLAEARDEAHRWRKVARGGGDPLAERRKTRRIVPSFEGAAREFHETKAAGFRNPKHRKQWLSSLGGAFAAFGSLRVDDVGSPQILALLRDDWLRRPETARRVLQRIRTVLDWSKAKGFRGGDNPTEGLTKLLPPQRKSVNHHAALPYADLPTFLADLRASSAGEAVKLALEFNVLCATRTSETLSARWSEFDLPSATWTIPGHRMKAGVEHRVPLSGRCIEILVSARKLGAGDFVFAGRSENRPLSNMAFLMALRRMGRADVTPHGFRSTFRDWAAEQTNVPHAVCEAALAHTVRNKVEAAYNRSDLFERRRELMAQWARFAVAFDSPGQGRDHGHATK